MANLIIKSSADNLILQGSDASPAITVGATGTTTFAENATFSGTANVYGQGTFPAGHVIQTKCHHPSNISIGTTSGAYPSTALGFDNAIKSSSDVLIMFGGTFIDASSNNNAYIDSYINGGGLGSGTSGRYWANAPGYRITRSNVDLRVPLNYASIDTSPGSTTPTYNLHIVVQAGFSATWANPYFIFQEIAG